MRPDELERAEQKTQAYAELATRMRHLRESEDFQVLRDSMREAKKKVLDQHLKALMRGAALNQRQMDYDRGYWDGVAQVLEAPWSALQAYEKALERVSQLGRKEATVGD